MGTETSSDEHAFESFGKIEFDLDESVGVVSCTQRNRLFKFHDLVDASEKQQVLDLLEVSSVGSQSTVTSERKHSNVSDMYPISAQPMSALIRRHKNSRKKLLKSSRKRRTKKSVPYQREDSIPLPVTIIPSAVLKDKAKDIRTILPQCAEERLDPTIDKPILLKTKLLVVREPEKEQPRRRNIKKPLCDQREGSTSIPVTILPSEVSKDKIKTTQHTIPQRPKDKLQPTVDTNILLRTSENIVRKEEKEEGNSFFDKQDSGNEIVKPKVLPPPYPPPKGKKSELYRKHVEKKRTTKQEPLFGKSARKMRSGTKVKEEIVRINSNSKTYRKRARGAKKRKQKQKGKQLRRNSVAEQKL